MATGAHAATTLENMQAAFNGESNAHARYVAFAAQADKEGYAEVASLFVRLLEPKRFTRSTTPP